MILRHGPLFGWCLGLRCHTVTVEGVGGKSKSRADDIMTEVRGVCPVEVVVRGSAGRNHEIFSHEYDVNGILPVAFRGTERGAIIVAYYRTIVQHSIVSLLATVKSRGLL